MNISLLFIADKRLAWRHAGAAATLAGARPFKHVGHQTKQRAHVSVIRGGTLLVVVTLGPAPVENVDGGGWVRGDGGYCILTTVHLHPIRAVSIPVTGHLHLFRVRHKAHTTHCTLTTYNDGVLAFLARAS
jgi:hypothetical protein